MGLRQLYFLIGGLLQRLVYLSLGLSVVLGFIGVKLVMEALHENELPFINGGEHVEGIPEIPIWVSLAFILTTLAVTTVASLLKVRRDSREAKDVAAPDPAVSVRDQDESGRSGPLGGVDQTDLAPHLVQVAMIASGLVQRHDRALEAAVVQAPRHLGRLVSQPAALVRARRTAPRPCRRRPPP